MNWFKRYRQHIVLFSGALLLCFNMGARADDVQDAEKLYQQKQYDQALEKVDTILTAKPKDIQALFLKGNILAAKGKIADAIGVFQTITEDAPERPEPYNNLAVLFASEGRYDEAKYCLQKAIRTNPTYATAEENLGDIYAKMASVAYDKALKLDRSNTTAKIKLALIKDIFTPPQEKTEAAARPARKIAKAAPRHETKAAAPAVAAPPAHVASQAAPKPARKPAAVTQQGNREVVRTIQAWAAAWSARDVKKYLSFYGAGFKPPHHMRRAGWQALRTRRLRRPRYLHVTVSDFKIEHRGNSAGASFTEHYVSNLLKSVTGKVLLMERHDGAWKIVSER